MTSENHLSTEFPAVPAGIDPKSRAINAAISNMVAAAADETAIFNANVDAMRHLVETAKGSTT